MNSLAADTPGRSDSKAEKIAGKVPVISHDSPEAGLLLWRLFPGIDMLLYMLGITR